MLQRALGILGAGDELRQFTRALQAEPQGTLRLSCNTDFALVAANRWISGYLARWPRVNVDVEFSARQVDLVHEGFDLALRVGTLDDSRLAARRLGELRYGLYASPAYLARAGTPTDPAGLASHALLMFRTGSGRAAWSLLPPGGGAAVELRRDGRVLAGSVTLLLQAALDGHGIARLPLAVAAQTAPGTLQRVLPGWTPEPAAVHAVYPSSRYLAPRVRAFIDHALAHFEPPSA